MSFANVPPLKAVYNGVFSLNFGTVSTLTTSSLFVTLQGVAVGDIVVVTGDNTLPPNAIIYGYVNASNQVAVAVTNPSASSAVCSTATFRVAVFSFL